MANIQWEYKSIEGSSFIGSDLDVELNKMADNGWEYLTDITQTSTTGATSTQRLLFRRQKLPVIDMSRTSTTERKYTSMEIHDLCSL